jgi:peptidoglycan/xylan/chitin deacetylase (PgdA/CDA1 family)
MLRRIKRRLNRRLSRLLATQVVHMNNARPIVSFTFDDVPRSAATDGATILEQVGACGTFYVAGSLCGIEKDGRYYASPDQVAVLNERGHEIGCHTFSHVSVAQLGRERVRCEIQRNEAFIRDICGDVSLYNFAYPFGDISLACKYQLRSMFASCRGIGHGINCGVLDLALLKSVPLYDRLSNIRQILSYIEENIKKNGWLIFYTHDVDVDARYYGTSIATLQFALHHARAMGCDILTIRNALSAITFPGQTAAT